MCFPISGNTYCIGREQKMEKVLVLTQKKVILLISGSITQRSGDVERLFSADNYWSKPSPLFIVEVLCNCRANKRVANDAGVGA